MAKSTQCTNMAAKVLLVAALILYTFWRFAESSKAEKEKEKTKIDKDILDYSESDIYRLLDQWDENDEDFDPEDYDDTDPRKPPPKQPQFDPTKIKDDPTAFMKMAKKGKTLMVFVQVASKYDKKEAELITGRWQQSLFNAQFQIQRYMVSDSRAIFMLQDGSTAWEIKDFIIKQPECESVEFDNQKFPGPGAPPTEKTRTEL